jgi:hypothetical protein
MLKACVNTVYKPWISLVQASKLSAVSTGQRQHIVSRLVFKPRLYFVFEHSNTSYRQLILGVFTQLGDLLYPLSTGPMNTTKLIKDY